MPSLLRSGAPAPQLKVETLAHGAWDLAQDAPPGGTYVFFHRGGHCKWTRFVIKELDDRIGDFALRAVRVIAVSGDDRNATEALKERMQIIRLPLGHSADMDALARDWGLCLTEGSTEPEAPPRHLEPAQAWVTAEGNIGAISIQSAPCMWSDATNTLRAIEQTSKFPERGAAGTGS